MNFFNFSDSVLNGAVNAIRELCDLLIKNNVKIKWGGQAVIRKEMTSDLLKVMQQAGCTYLGYGLESGSNQVLQSMNKKLFTVEMASDVIKATHEAKINAYVNVMFGYPTETDADFLKTLEFIKDNRNNIDGVSPSQSFTIIVKNTYLYDHLSEFNIDPNPHHLYWKTKDGKNTYPIRFKRYEMFCKLCIDMGLSGVGVLAEKSDKWILLGEYYYEHEKDYENAFECFKTDLMQNGFSTKSMERFIASGNKLGKYDEAQTLVNIFQLDKIRTIKTAETLEANQVYSASKHTDENWVSGVARSWAAAFS